MRLAIILFISLCLSTLSAQTNQSDLVNNSKGIFPNTSFKYYSGYLKLTETKFFHYMFFESNQTSNLTDPVVLWLNGGPGCSSLLGAFQENGPFLFNINKTGLQPEVNPYSWNNFSNVLYIESPAGVGFSNDTNATIASNSNDLQTAHDNLAAVLAWFERFPAYRNNEFYVTGESYAGTYVPFLSLMLHEYNINQTENPGKKVNFKGYAVGNGCTDPTECVGRKMKFKNDQSIYVYDFYWGQGKYSPRTRAQYESTCMVNPNGAPCQLVRQKILDEVGILYNEIDVYDIYRPCYNQTGIPGAPPCTDAMAAYAFFRDKTVMEVLHVNPDIYWDMCSDLVGNNYVDYPDASYWIYKQLVPLQQYKILVYSGDTDSSVPITGTLHWLNNLRSELQLPVMNPWRPWFYPGEKEGESQVAGYTMELQGLTFASVRGVGHMVPQWGPSQAYVMLKNFLAGNELPYN